MGTSVAKKPEPGRKSPSPGIADVLFTKVQQRVLGVLFGNPDRSFYANQVITLAGSGTGAVQRELQKMVGAGLLTVRRVGNQKHYQANSSSPIFNELRGIVLKTTGLVDVLRSALAPMDSHIQAAFVFGSVAKGDDTADSDIDLFVLSDSLEYPELFSTLEPVRETLYREVNPTIMTLEDWRKRRRKRNAFSDSIVSKPKLWIIGSENDIPS